MAQRRNLFIDFWDKDTDANVRTAICQTPLMLSNPLVTRVWAFAIIKCVDESNDSDSDVAETCSDDGASPHHLLLWDPYIRSKEDLLPCQRHLIIQCKEEPLHGVWCTPYQPNEAASSSKDNNLSLANDWIQSIIDHGGRALQPSDIRCKDFLRVDSWISLFRGPRIY